MGGKNSAMIKFSRSKQSYNTDRQDGGHLKSGSQQGTATLGGRGVSDEVEGPGGRMQRIHTDPSGVKLTGLIPMLLNPRPQALEACPLGSRTAEGPLARSSTPSSQKEPGCFLKSRSLRYWEQRALRLLFQTHKAKGIYGFGNLALEPRFLMSKSLRSRWLSAQD